MAKHANLADTLQALDRKWFYSLTLVGGLLLWALAAVFWWLHIYQAPEKVFWEMFNTSLSTPGVTKQLIQKSEDGDLDQTIRLSFGSGNVSESTVQLSRKDPSGKGSVTSQTQTFGTLTTDYARYVDFKDSRPNNPKPDLSPLLGIWGKSEPRTPKGGQLLRESILNIVPFANLSKSQRQKLIKTMQQNKVYTFDSAKVTRQSHYGRLTYTYKVKVKPQQYVQLLQTFAKDIGLGELTEFTPDAYENAKETEINMTIDAASRQLRTVSYADQDRTETYSGFGVISTESAPNKTIPLSELQNRLQKL